MNNELIFTYEINTNIDEMPCYLCDSDISPDVGYLLSSDRGFQFCSEKCAIQYRDGIKSVEQLDHN